MSVQTTEGIRVAAWEQEIQKAENRAKSAEKDAAIYRTALDVVRLVRDLSCEERRRVEQIVKDVIR